MDADTAKYLFELDDQIERLWRTLESHSTAEEYRRSAQEYLEKANHIEKQVQDYRNELAVHVKNLSEESARYVNIVSVIGYAGYFATWGFTKDILGKETTAFVGLAGMLSVGIFVLWEMFNIMLRLKAVGAIGHIFQSGTSVEHFEEMSQKLKRDEAKAIAIFTPVHRIVFTVSSLAAIAGGLAMMHKLYTTL
jgi:hypothetical protein